MKPPDHVLCQHPSQVACCSRFGMGKKQRGRAALSIGVIRTEYRYLIVHLLLDIIASRRQS
jgi:hypothetical protein